MKRVLILVAIALVAASCGNKKAPLVHTGPKGVGVQQTYQLTADAHGKLEFDKKALDAGAGPVHLVMFNPSSVPHNIAVKGNGVKVEGRPVRSGRQSTVTVTLKPGVYEFYCSVDGHERAGMKGTLRVGSKRKGSAS